MTMLDRSPGVARRAIFRVCGAFGLTRGDRMDLASTFLDRNVESYSDLDPIELARLRDGFEFAALLCQLQMEKRRGQRR